MKICRRTEAGPARGQVSRNTNGTGPLVVEPSSNSASEILVGEDEATKQVRIPFQCAGPKCADTPCIIKHDAAIFSPRELRSFSKESAAIVVLLVFPDQILLQFQSFCYAGTGSPQESESILLPPGLPTVAAKSGARFSSAVIPSPYKR